MRLPLSRRPRTSGVIQRRRGAAVVEFAFVAPVFMLFLVGILEFGRVMTVKNVLTNATREGARMATLPGSTTDSVTEATTEYASTAAISGVIVDITPSNWNTSTSGTPVTVTASVNFSDISLLPAPWFMDGRTVSGSTTMRRESLVITEN
jgi:Flp pilus assembly protein TadG